MTSQTPPAVPVSEDQLAKWLQVTQDRIRKGKLDSPTFQYILGHSNLAGQLDEMFDSMATEYRLNKLLIERPPFMSIQIGTFENVKAMRQALKDAKCNVSDYASDLMDDLMDRMTLVAEPTTLDLYKATNAELGLTQGGTIAQSFEAIAKFGGVKLPAEAGPQYRLQNSDQKLGEWELMCMDPIAGRYGYPCVFCVAHDGGGLWLDGRFARPGYFYFADFVWVFGRKRPA